MVELRGRLVVLLRPRETAVEGDVHTAVVALDHPLRVARVDPQVVVVAVRRGDRAEGAPAVARAHELDVEHVDAVEVLRVGDDVGVVPGALPQAAVLVGAPPGAAGVVGAVDAALVRLDRRPHAVRVDRRDRDPDAAPQALGQALAGEPLPGVAAVHRLPEPAPGPAALETPRRAVDLPGGGVQDARVLGVQAQVHRPGAVVDEQHAFPRLPAVAGAVDTTLVVGAEGVAEGGDVDDVGVARVDAHPPDLARVAQAHVLPGAPRVHRLVDPVPVRDVAADTPLAHAGVEHVGVRLADRDRPHRAGAELAVGHVRPRHAAVDALPDAAARAAEVVDVALAHHAGHRGHAPAAQRTDVAPFETGELGLVEGIHRARGLGRLGGS